MNYNGFHGKGGKKSLNDYFNQARHEAVDFSQDDAKKMIAKHAVAIGSLGIIGKLFYNLGLKGISVISAALVTTTVVTYTWLSGDDKEILQTSHTPNNYVEQRAEVSSSRKEEMKSGIEAVFSEEKNPEDQDVSNSTALSAQTNPTAQSVLQTPQRMADTRLTEKTKNPNESLSLTDGAPKIKTSKSKPEQRAPEAVSNEEISQDEYKFQSLFLVDIESNEIVASLELEPVIDHDYRSVLMPEIEPERMKTLVDDFAKHNAYWFSYEPMKYDFTTNKKLTGGKIGWTFNKKYTLALGGYGLFKSDVVNVQGAEGDYAMGYGGLVLEYTERPNDLVHFSLNSLIGFGGNTVMLYDQASENPVANPWSAFFVFEPGATAELHVTNFLKVGVTYTYRLADSFHKNESYKASDDLMRLTHEGSTLGIYIKAGLF
jgi:hypothetical protein